MHVKIVRNLSIKNILAYVPFTCINRACDDRIFGHKWALSVFLPDKPIYAKIQKFIHEIKSRPKKRMPRAQKRQVCI